MRILGIWLLLLCSSAMGRDIFVDNMAGNDRATGRYAQSTPELSGPVQTIVKALSLATNGDTILLANNPIPYHESISLVGSRCSGTAQQPFTILGNGAILDGSTAVPPEAWQSYKGSIFRFQPSQLGQQQLFLDDRPASQVFVPQASHEVPELQPKQWCQIDGQVYFAVEPTKLPTDYKLSYAAQQTGITLFHVRHVLIADLMVQGFRHDGIHLQNSAKDIALLGVTCRGNARSGLTVGGASSARIERSLLGNNGRMQLLTLPYSETSLRDTHLLSNTAPGWVDQGGRVYFDEVQKQGGLDEYHPDTAQEKKL